MEAKRRNSKKIWFAATLFMAAAAFIILASGPAYQFLSGAKLQTYSYSCQPTGCESTKHFILDRRRADVWTDATSEFTLDEGWFVSNYDRSQTQPYFMTNYGTLANPKDRREIGIREGAPSRRFADGTYIAPTVVYVKEPATIYDWLFHRLLENKYPVPTYKMPYDE